MGTGREKGSEGRAAGTGEGKRLANKEERGVFEANYQELRNGQLDGVVLELPLGLHLDDHRDKGRVEGLAQRGRDAHAQLPVDADLKGEHEKGGGKRGLARPRLRFPRPQLRWGASERLWGAFLW